MEKYIIKKGIISGIKSAFSQARNLSSTGVHGIAGNVPQQKFDKQTGGKPGLQLLPSKKNPNVKRWEQTQKKQTENGQNAQADVRVPGKREPYWGKHSGAEVGHRINYHGNHITITGVGEHGVTARDEHGRKHEIFHHELRRKGNNGK